LKLPTLTLLLTDVVAASLSTCLMFGLGYAFAHQIQSGIREVQQWVTLLVALSVAIWLLIRYYKARRRAGLPVGPPVLDSDDVPLPAGDRRGAPISHEAVAHTETGSTARPLHGETTSVVDLAAPSESAPVVEPGRPDSDLPAPNVPPARHRRGPVMIDLDAGHPQSTVESPSR
jgi:hypothetical protein